MPAIYEHRHRVQPEEIDELNHAGNVAYLTWMQSAALAHSAAQGWPAEAYHALRAGWMVRSHEITYLNPAFLDDELVVETWVADFQKVTSLRRYRVLRPADGRLLAEAATNWVFVNYDTRLPKRIPLEVSQAFEVRRDEASPG